MADRMVRVFDGPVPSVEQLTFNDPDRPSFPKEVWASQMEDNEVALFCLDAKTQIPVREENGRPGPRSEEYCRVSSDVNELRLYAKRIVEEHPGVVCVLCAKDQTEIERIYRRREAFSVFGLASHLLALTVYLAVITAIGFPPFMLLYYLLGVFIEGHRASFLTGVSTVQWAAYLTASFILGMCLVLAATWISVLNRVHRQHRSMKKKLTPDEIEKYRSIDALSVSADINERRIASQLSKEFFERLRGVLVKRDR